MVAADSNLPTLKDVARAAGVHVSTASRALSIDQRHNVSDSTRSKVKTAAEQLGYRTNAVAQSLRRGNTGTIGVVVADLMNPFNTLILRGIEHGTRNQNIMPLVVETHDDPALLRRVLERLLSNRVDAIVLCAAQAGDEALVSELERSVPVVLAVRGFGGRSNSVPTLRHSEVLHDDYLGARTATAHLASLGHRRIAQLPGIKEIYSFAERSAGFRASLREHPEVHDCSSGSVAIETSLAEGRRLTNELLRQYPDNFPTALFAHNDLMAVGAIVALRDAGLSCPSDVSVIGYNDAPMSDQFDPPLTTVRLPSFELGRHSARLALDAISDGEKAKERIILAPEFIERKSTAHPRNAI